MAKYNRINWHTGMEITPQVLIDADNFQIEQQNIIRRLQVMPCYGLLPESAFNEDNTSKQFITPTGKLIDFNEQDAAYTGNIPPCISINSHQNLLQKFNEIKERINNILIEIKEQEKYKAILVPLSLLQLELDNYSTHESPVDLFLLVKKIVLHFKLNNSELIEATEKMINTTYCHTEIDTIFSFVIEYLNDLEMAVKAPKIEEKPKIQRIQIAVK